MARKRKRTISPYRKGRSIAQLDAATRAFQEKQLADRKAEQAAFEQRRAERASRLQAEQAAQREKERGRREAMLKRTARQEWIDNGGDVAGFDDAWPAMFETILQQKATQRAASGLGDELDQAVRAVSSL